MEEDNDNNKRRESNPFAQQISDWVDESQRYWVLDDRYGRLRKDEVVLEGDSGREYHVMKLNLKEVVTKF